MRVNLFATFYTYTGVREITLDLPPGVTVRQVVQEIVRRYPVLNQKWLDEDGELYTHVHIFLHRDEAAELVHDLNSPLATDDVLDFFPPVAGG